MRFLVLALLILAGVAPFEASAKVGLCEQIFAPAGHIEGFKPFFEPVFHLQDLLLEKENLGRRNSGFGLAKPNYYSEWVIEYRKVQGENAPSIRAVKYKKIRDDVYEEQQASRSMRLAFEKLDLLKKFDVLMPLAVVGSEPAHAVYPYLEARSLGWLSRRAHRAAGRVVYEPESGGPVEARLNPMLARIWEEQQSRLRAVVDTLIVNGFRIEEHYSTSFEGKRYLDFVMVYAGWIEANFTLSDDILVTTDLDHLLKYLKAK